MTIFRRRWRNLLAGVAISLLLPCAALAQQPAGESGLPSPKIAIVNVEVALRESTAVESVRAQMNDISVRYKKEIDDEEAKLRALDQELQQQRAILAPEAFAQRREEFQKQAAELQQKARAVRQAMDRGFKDTMQRIQSVLFEEVAKLADEIDVNLVLPSSQIIVSVETLNITPQAIERLNARLPDVKLTMEEKPTEGGQAQPQPAPPAR